MTYLATQQHEHKGTSKRGHIVADTLLVIMFLGRANARDTEWILCFHAAQTQWETFVADTKCFWTKSETFFVSRTQNLCRARANGETFVSATMCPQQCVLVCQGLNDVMSLLRTRLEKSSGNPPEERKWVFWGKTPIRSHRCLATVSQANWV